MNSRLQRAVLNTLCYAHVFSFALTREELYYYLISVSSYPSYKVREMIDASPFCIHKERLICLKGHESLLVKRKHMQRFVKKKMNQALQATRLLGWIPTISAIYITGGLAMGNVQKQDDIDFMVIARPRWLWTTRILVILLACLFGKYRHKNITDTTDTWCFNLWLDETTLTLPPKARNLYSAHEVVQAKPLLDKKNIHHYFLSQNSWVKQYLPHPFVGLKRQHTPFSIQKKNPSFVERICFWIQSQYMASSKTREKIGISYAFFHPRNTGAMVMERYKRIVETYGI